MARVILRVLECIVSESWPSADSCKLKVWVDGELRIEQNRNMDNKERWVLNLAYDFTNRVGIDLIERDRGPFERPDRLGSVTIPAQPVPRSFAKFSGHGSDYRLWYEVDPPPEADLQQWSVRENLGRARRGSLTLAEHAGVIGSGSLFAFSEIVSVRDAMALHAPQDGIRGATTSLRTWLVQHCNLWGEAAIIPFASTPKAFSDHELLGAQPNWLPVSDERSRVISGIVVSSHPSHGDHPLRHETLDWIWNVLPDPSFSYMVNYTAKGLRAPSGAYVPVSHNEWEQGSMPLEWRPFPGEYVTSWGRHIFDVGHAPVHTEIHPAHTVVRERCTAAVLDPTSGDLVPVSRAVIGMGLSGGFPVHVGPRWQDEFGSKPAEISGDTADCWATNLSRHPLRYKLFPPTPRPSNSARLVANVVKSEWIAVSSFRTVDRFLELCQEDDPARGGRGLGFRRWDRDLNLPHSFVPEPAPEAAQPRLLPRSDSDGMDAYFDVAVDLTVDGLTPLAYLAVIDCGWSEIGSNQISSYDVTFESVYATDTDEVYDDWHLFYGVNGEWAAWYADDRVEEGRSYDSVYRSFRVFTVNDQPLVIQDWGYDWDGVDEGRVYSGNTRLARLRIVAQPDHFDHIASYEGVSVLARSTNSLRFRAVTAQRKEDEPRHEWTMKIDRL